MTDIRHVVIIGAGNVATHLARALKEAGFVISQVYSRTQDAAEELALNLNSKFTSNPADILPDADLYIVSVTDDALETLAENLNFKKQLVVHTSGSILLDVIRPMSESIGVLYPLQTLSKAGKANFKNIPICIEANSADNLERIRKIALRLSDDVRDVNSEQRKQLHLAAVFACNFTNYMYTIAGEILNQSGLDMNFLLPLIKETARKIETISPVDAQTGPALRGDKNVMEQHLTMLARWPAYQEIYQQISSEILKSKSRKHE